MPRAGCPGKKYDMTALAHTRSGSGAPLVLLHPLGSSRRVWEPVLPELSRRFDVIAVDLPGFGESEPLPPQVEPSPTALAASVAGLLDDLGVPSPHVAGNSLGGWVALELAGIRPVASLTLLSPAGLWRGGAPRYDLLSLRASRWFAAHGAGILSRLVDHPLGRILVLGQTHGRPVRMTPDYAQASIRDLATSTGFDAALRGTATRHYVSGAPIDAPVTIAFGSRDVLLLPWQSRNFGELPPNFRVGTLPGCGHVPASDNPPAVVALIAESAARSASAH